MKASSFPPADLSTFELEGVVRKWDGGLSDILEEISTFDGNAVESIDESRTYSDFVRNTNRIATYLRSAIQGEVLAISLPPSILRIELLVAALKAKICVVPLGEEEPPLRLKRKLSQLGPCVLVSDVPIDAPHLRCISSRDIEAASKAVTTTFDEVSGESITPQPTKSEVAYIVFTSGSSGKPKGIRISRSSLNNLLRWAKETYDISHADRASLLAAFEFDVALEEILTPLIAGATLVLPHTRTPSFSKLTHWLADEKITLAQIPTAYFRAWIHATDEQLRLPALKTIVIGGEAFDGASVKQWFSRKPKTTKLINAYGPSECTVTSLFHEICPEDEIDVPIGKPIANIHISIVNDELLIGGVCCGTSYLDGKENHRFVERDVGRFYQSGDLVAVGHHHNLLFRGRRDEQHQVRGHRVEIGEITSAFLALPALEDVFVDIVDGQISLYFVEKHKEHDLKSTAKKMLPNYMHPARYISVRHIPTNQRGKVDRGALRRLERISTPRNDGDQDLVVSLLCQLLSDRIGHDFTPDDDLFANGVTSLDALHLIDKLGELGFHISPDAFFQVRNVHELVNSLELRQSKEESELLTLRDEGEDGPIFLLHSGPGDLLGYMHLIEHLPRRFQLYGIQARGVVDIDHADQSIEEMAMRYARILRKHELHRGGHYVGLCFGAQLALECARAIHRLGGYADSVVMLDVEPLDGGKDRVQRMVQKGIKALGDGPSKWKSLIRHRLEAQHDWRSLGQNLKSASFFTNRAYLQELNHRAYDAHRNRKYHGEVLLIQGREPREKVVLPGAGWPKYLNRLEVDFVDGEHEDLLNHTHARASAASMVRYWDTRKKR